MYKRQGYIDVENEEIKRLRKEIELLRIRNSHLKDEVTKLNRENKNLKENPRTACHHDEYR